MEKSIVIISLAVSFLTLVTIIWSMRDKIFSHGSEEQKMVDRVIDLEKTDEYFSKSIGAMKEDIKNIEKNHLTHMERDINNINVHLAEINTTLKFIIKEH